MFRKYLICFDCYFSLVLFSSVGLDLLLIFKLSVLFITLIAGDYLYCGKTLMPFRNMILFR